MKKVKCSKCGHGWETQSKLKMVTCPSCQLKVKIKLSKANSIVIFDEGEK